MHKHWNIPSLDLSWAIYKSTDLSILGWSREENKKNTFGNCEKVPAQEYIHFYLRGF